jgi:hypothetical protein
MSFIFDILKAALIGAPIPLCSCGVIPAAEGLRQAGAGKGATGTGTQARGRAGPGAFSWLCAAALLALLLRSRLSGRIKACS